MSHNKLFSDKFWGRFSNKEGHPTHRTLLKFSDLIMDTICSEARSEKKCCASFLSWDLGRRMLTGLLRSLLFNLEKLQRILSLQEDSGTLAQVLQNSMSDIPFDCLSSCILNLLLLKLLSSKSFFLFSFIWQIFCALSLVPSSRWKSQSFRSLNAEQAKNFLDPLK